MADSVRYPEFISLGYCSNDHLCRLPEIPIDHKVEMIEHEIQGGGPAADAAVAAARLGLSTLFATSIGDDDDGRRILRDLEAEGIDTSRIAVRPGCGSPISYCWIDAAGKRSVAWSKNGLKLLTAAEAPVDLIPHAKLLHLDGHHPDAAVAAAQAAHEAGVPVCLDAGTFTPRIDELLELTDLLIASEYFARRATGETDLDRALVGLLRYGARVTGITLGEGGSIFWNDGKILRCPIFQLPVVDTTGAGDSFHAGFEFQYLRTNDLMSCARFASAVSGLKCGRLGARAGLPTLEQVETFLANQR